MWKKSVYLKHSCCIQSVVVPKKKHYLLLKFQAELATFFLNTVLYLKDRQTAYTDLGVRQTFSQKWTKQACHCQSFSLKYFVPMKKIPTFKQKLKFWRTSSTLLNLTASVWQWCFWCCIMQCVVTWKLG